MAQLSFVKHTLVSSFDRSVSYRKENDLSFVQKFCAKIITACSSEDSIGGECSSSLNSVLYKQEVSGPDSLNIWKADVKLSAFSKAKAMNLGRPH